MCNHVFKPLWYVYDAPGCITSIVYLENGYVPDKRGQLAYCTQCGRVFVREIAEKTRRGKHEVHIGDEVTGEYGDGVVSGIAENVIHILEKMKEESE